MNPELAIIGGGPAGLAAAAEAASHGIPTLLLDENPAPGGRIWQALERRGAHDPDDEAGLQVIRRFRASGVDARWCATVWNIEPGPILYWNEAEVSRSASPQYLILATGAMERPLPLPGWTLPGVMGVGAAQTALKTGGLLPDEGTWIAGQGPLLLLYTVQVLREGGRIAGILDLSDGFAPLRALRHLPLRGGSELRKGLAWRREIAAAGVAWISASDLLADGSGTLERISFRTHGIRRSEPATTLLLHDGVIPSVQITRAQDCAHQWDAAQQCWKPAADDWGFTSQPNVLAAGDGAGILGAGAAVLSGRIAALAVAHALGRIGAIARDALAAQLFAARQRQRAMRRFLDTLYPSRPLHLDDKTLVCRCEEVTAHEIRRAGQLGVQGLNQLKAFTRCGMGPCQGRMCATSAAQVLAEVRGVPVQQVAPLRTRFPTKPVTVGEIAGAET
jgi:NADPH-dependent 2,4-dienoyl-CoA reductase/sulfur reductase-like enzyme